MYTDSDLAHPADSRILKSFTWDDIALPSLAQWPQKNHLNQMYRRRDIQESDNK